MERRAFKHALYAVRDEHLALDLVQESMMRLADKYAAKPAEELPLLFHRILQNTIRDHYRRQKVRNLWSTMLSSLSSSDDEDDDPLERINVDDGVSGPAEVAERAQAFRAALDRLAPDEASAQALVDEALDAFARHRELFEQLERPLACH